MKTTRRITINFLEVNSEIPPHSCQFRHNLRPVPDARTCSGLSVLSKGVPLSHFPLCRRNRLRERHTPPLRGYPSIRRKSSELSRLYGVDSRSRPPCCSLSMVPKLTTLGALMRTYNAATSKSPSAASLRNPRR